MESGTRFPQPLTGRAADRLSCSEGAVSSLLPSSLGHRGWPGTRLPFPAPSGSGGGTPAPPWGSWCQRGWSVGTASAEGASPGHGVVRVSQMKGREARRGKSQLLTAASALGKLRGCHVLKERQFFLSKIFLFIHSLLAAGSSCWVRALCGVQSGGCSLLPCLLSLRSTGSRVWASLPRGTQDPPRPGVEPTAPALASGFLAPGPPVQSSSQTPCETRLMSAFLNSILNRKVIFVHFKNERKLEDADPFTQRESLKLFRSFLASLGLWAYGECHLVFSL